MPSPLPRRETVWQVVSALLETLPRDIAEEWVARFDGAAVAQREANEAAHKQREADEAYERSLWSVDEDAYGPYIKRWGQ